MRPKLNRLFIFISLLLFPLSSQTFDKSGRYFFEGDGSVRLVNAKTGDGGTFKYHSADDQYNLQTLDRINEVFGLKTAPDEFIAPRLIALLDYLQDKLKGGTIRIVSGYRSPNYNNNWRKKGRLAARTSLHIEGMAADIEMDGVDGKKLWEFVRSLDCCGAGYYHGKGIHVDVGPSRFWDETSTKVEQDLGARNKLILLRTNFDYYQPGERIYMTLGRITDYPVGIRPKVILVTPAGKEVAALPLDLEGKGLKKSDCVPIPDRSWARSIEFDLPEKIDSREKIQVRMEFCEKPFPEMPDRIESNPVSIEIP